MTTWTIVDSQINTVAGFDIAWLPPQASTYVTPHVYHKPGKVEHVALETGPYVGTLPLTTGDVLYIEPRVGREVFSRMLSVTARLDSAVQKEFEQFARLGYNEQDSVSWVQLLARSFLNQLRFIEKSSLRAERVRKVQRGQSVRGQILVAPTLASLLRYEEDPVHFAYRTRTCDTIEHRVLGAAAATLLRLQAVEDKDREVVLRWATKPEKEPLSGEELSLVIQGLNAGRYTGPRSYYISALVMAQLILAQGGVTFEDSLVNTEALLTNVYTLFESYIRITLRTVLAKDGYVVEKLESGPPTLFADGTAELIPDVVISDRQGVRLIVDAKYKLDDAIKASDYYQMSTYLKGYQVQNGLIVRPHPTRQTTSLVSRRMNYGGIIHELTLGIADWRQAEIGLVEGITSALTAALADSA